MLWNINITLQRCSNKRKIETLVALHSHRTSSSLPQALEQEFWQQNTERARINISQSFAAGVWAYLLFTALVLPVITGFLVSVFLCRFPAVYCCHA